MHTKRFLSYIMPKRFFMAATVTLCACATADAQTVQEGKLFRNGIFNHIDFAVSGGTSGIGFEFAAPVTDMFRVRVGGVFMPQIH